MNRDDKKTATLKMTLIDSSGFKSETEGKISTNQWKDIHLVLSGKLSSAPKKEKV